MSTGLFTHNRCLLLIAKQIVKGLLAACFAIHLFFFSFSFFFLFLKIKILLQKFLQIPHMSFTEEDLWRACAVGDLSAVKTLSSRPDISVNWIGPERGDTPLHRACRFNHLPVVEFLLSHPQVNVNAQNARGGTPFSLACQEGHRAIAMLFCADPRVDVNLPQNEGASPFLMACSNGKTDVVEMLLRDLRVEVNQRWSEGTTGFFVACVNAHEGIVSVLLLDERVDINWPASDNCTPLWFVAQEGHLQLARLILASGRSVDTTTKSMIGTSQWNNTTAAEQARFQGKRNKANDESEEEYLRAKVNGPLIADLLNDFEQDPERVRRGLRDLPEIRNSFVAAVFALIIFHADGLLQLKVAKHPKATSPEGKCHRFLCIAQMLPMDLQMVLCNRLFGSPKDIVLSKLSEPHFQKLARHTWTS